MVINTTADWIQEPFYNFIEDDAVATYCQGDEMILTGENASGETVWAWDSRTPTQLYRKVKWSPAELVLDDLEIIDNWQQYSAAASYIKKLISIMEARDDRTVSF